MRTLGDRVPGAQWFSGNDAITPYGVPMSIPKRVTRDQQYAATLDIPAADLHAELASARMRYELLLGFAAWVADQRKTEGVTVETICDAADRALRGDKSIEVANDDAKAAGRS